MKVLHLMERVTQISIPRDVSCHHCLFLATVFWIHTLLQRSLGNDLWQLILEIMMKNNHQHELYKKMVMLLPVLVVAISICLYTQVASLCLYKLFMFKVWGSKSNKGERKEPWLAKDRTKWAIWLWHLYPNWLIQLTRLSMLVSPSSITVACEGLLKLLNAVSKRIILLGYKRTGLLSRIWE